MTKFFNYLICHGICIYSVSQVPAAELISYIQPGETGSSSFSMPSQSFYPLFWDVFCHPERFKKIDLEGTNTDWGYGLFQMEREEAIYYLREALKDPASSEYVSRCIFNELWRIERPLFTEIVGREIPHLEKKESITSEDLESYLIYLENNQSEMRYICNWVWQRDISHESDDCFGIINALAYIKSKNLSLYRKCPDPSMGDFILTHRYVIDGFTDYVYFVVHERGYNILELYHLTPPPNKLPQPRPHVYIDFFLKQGAKGAIQKAVPIGALPTKRLQDGEAPQSPSKRPRFEVNSLESIVISSGVISSGEKEKNEWNAWKEAVHLPENKGWKSKIESLVLSGHILEFPNSVDSLQQACLILGKQDVSSWREQAEILLFLNKFVQIEKNPCFLRETLTLLDENDNTEQEWKLKAEILLSLAQAKMTQFQIQDLEKFCLFLTEKDPQKKEWQLWVKFYLFWSSIPRIHNQRQYQEEASRLLDQNDPHKNAWELWIGYLTLQAKTQPPHMTIQTLEEAKHIFQERDTWKVKWKLWADTNLALGQLKRGTEQSQILTDLLTFLEVKDPQKRNWRLWIETYLCLGKASCKRGKIDPLQQALRLLREHDARQNDWSLWAQIFYSLGVVEEDGFQFSYLQDALNLMMKRDRRLIKWKLRVNTLIAIGRVHPSNRAIKSQKQQLDSLSDALEVLEQKDKNKHQWKLWIRAYLALGKIPENKSRLNDLMQAQKILESRPKEYMLSGDLSLALAQYYACIGERGKALDMCNRGIHILQENGLDDHILFSRLMEWKRDVSSIETNFSDLG